MLADQHEGLNGIHPFLEYDKMKDNSPVSKRQLEEIIAALRIEFGA